MTNRYGLDADYHRGKLEIILRDIQFYTPEELSRSLLRLAVVARPIVLTETEFVNARMNAIQDNMNNGESPQTNS